jgi:UDP-N-acetylglucosamine 4,6-dehydratase (inverting)
MNKIFFKNKNLLITGGTGSFGTALAHYLLRNKFPLNKLIILSRDEFKQFEMSRNFQLYKADKILRFFLGDIRDKDRLKYAFRKVDYIVHAAALKQVPAAEYNPIEFVKTNIIGAQNIIETSLDLEVKKIIALSTDKACSPINLYGATKLCSDKLFISSNNISGEKKISFSVVRYGNVLNSRGSVLPEFIKQKKEGIIRITDQNMTRFNILLEDAVRMVIWSIINSKGGEIFVPKLSSYKVIDLAKVIAPNSKFIFVGIRPGEKIHEELISKNEMLNSFDIGKYYVIIDKNNKNYIFYSNKNKNINFRKMISYNSNTNNNFLNKYQIKKLISLN